MYWGFTGISRDQHWFLSQFMRLVVKEIDMSSSFVVVFGVVGTVVFFVVLGSYTQLRFSFNVGSSPSRNGGRVFFSRVAFLC